MFLFPPHLSSSFCLARSRLEGTCNSRSKPSRSLRPSQPGPWTSTTDIIWELFRVQNLRLHLDPPHRELHFITIPRDPYAHWSLRSTAHICIHAEHKSEPQTVSKTHRSTCTLHDRLQGQSKHTWSCRTEQWMRAGTLQSPKPGYEFHPCHSPANGPGCQLPAPLHTAICTGNRPALMEVSSHCNGNAKAFSTVFGT